MILEAITQHDPELIAIETSVETISYGLLLSQIALVYDWLVEHDVSVLLLESDNLPEWILSLIHI